MNNVNEVQTKLDEAIESYCTMLPYPNVHANPNDDSRLYTISRLAAKKDNTHITPEMLIPFLKENDNINLLDEENLNKFAEDRCKRINDGAHIISSAFKMDEL